MQRRTVALGVAGLCLAYVAPQIDPGRGQEADPCVRERSPDSGHPDIYCILLVPSPGVRGAAGHVRLERPPGPFSLAVTAEGRVTFDLVLETRGLPPPDSLGPYDRYVAWASTPSLLPVYRLGEVPATGRTRLGPVSLNKFLILVTAESSPDGAEPTGPFVLRAQSPSSRIRPADFLEFALGATALDSAGAGAAAGGGPDDAWGDVPVPEGLMMLPALMRLRPAVTPWRPGDGWTGRIVDARPRQLVRLADGDSMALEAVYVRRRIGDREVLGYGFNGQIPGPLLWVPEDATVTIGFTNSIDWPTAIHWHGIRLDNRFDGVPGVTQDPVAPGETFRYEVRFPDPGLYWYHPHHREDVQQDLGLAGNLMVQSRDPDYFSPAHREEVLMLDDLLLGPQGIVPYGLERATHALMGRFGNMLLVNGGRDYELDVRPGEIVRFFLTNASNTRTFNLSFAGAPMKVVGTDVGNFEREAWIESVLIAPAERYIVHVRFPEPGSYALLNAVQGIDHIGGRFFSKVDTLGMIRAGGSPVTPDHSASFERLREDPRVASSLDAYRSRFGAPIEKTLELDMEVRGFPLPVERLMQIDSAYFHPLEWVGTMPMMNLMTTPEEVSWILREPSTGAENGDIAWRFRVGDVVKLRLRSRRETLHQMQHPIHIHGQRFLVLAVNGVPNDNLAWKDTAVVPTGGTLDLLLELSNPGRWMLHCHIAEHLEAGMKMVFTVDDNGADPPGASD